VKIIDNTSNFFEQFWPGSGIWVNWALTSISALFGVFFCEKIKKFVSGPIPPVTEQPAPATPTKSQGTRGSRAKSPRRKRA
jgi:hypothetical protein